MSNEGFKIDKSIETTEMDPILEKPLKPILADPPKKKRVDINELVAKLEVSEKKRIRKNTIIFTFSILSLGIIGIFVSG